MKLSQFVREAWQHIPELMAVEYKHGWHIDFICEHLEAITYGRFLEMGLRNRLLANVPPGTMKSLLISVFWPAWEWANGFAHHAYICTSFAEKNCLRDAERMRQLVESEWYQSLYSKNWKPGTKKPNGDPVVHWGIKLERRGLKHLSNTRGGQRRSIAFGSLTQWRGDRVIIDDPHSTDTAESDVERAHTVKTFRSSVTSRLNDPAKSAIIVVMQRLHVGDISGLIEDNPKRFPYIHIMLPMRFEVDRRCVTPLLQDPRKVEGELLMPSRFPLEVVDADEAAMTEYDVAGQYQQRPYLRGGQMFQRGWFKTIPALPTVDARCRGWDLAATKAKNNPNQGPAWTAGIRISRAGEKIIIEHAQRQRTNALGVKRAIKLAAQIDPAGTRISIPQDPGQAGVAQKDSFAEDLVGYDVRFSPESGDKADRALPFSAQAEVGNVYILVTGDPVRDAWIEPFLDEICVFPASRFKDQADGATRAFSEVVRMTKGNIQGDLGGPPSQVH